jgi:hypothetical protein
MASIKRGPTCSQCGEDLPPRAKQCRNCGSYVADGKGPRVDPHQPQTCALCGRDGITGKTLSPLRTEMHGEDQGLRWSHDDCRRPTITSAHRCDLLLRGIEIHPDPMAAAIISASRDLKNKPERRELMALVKDWLGKAQALPYDPSSRLAG